MRVLFATHDGSDFLASTLWDGLQELLGPENVYDAGNNWEFHNSYFVRPSSCTASHAICGTRLGKHMGDEGDFDLLVLNACFLNQYHDWHWPWRLRERLRPEAKVVYVEGGDSAHDMNDPRTRSVPPFHVDKVFRREIDPEYRYPYEYEHLDFAAPARWIRETLKWDRQRSIDVYFAGGAGSNPVRWEMMQYLFDTRRSYTFVYSQQSTQYNIPFTVNLDMLRQSRIALCPPGGCNCTSTMRLYEVLAAGAIPVYVKHACRKQDPKTPGEWCHRLELLPVILNGLLCQDLEAYNRHVLEDALANHTTAARAKKLLDSVGA